MPLGNLTGTLGKKRAAHLLRRACFGSSVADIDLYSGLTAQQAFDRLITELPDPEPPLAPETGAEWELTNVSNTSESSVTMRALNSWIIDQAIASTITDEDLVPSYSFRERLVFFFHTLFTTKQSVVSNPRAIYFQQALFRKYAFDRDDRTRPDPESTDEAPLPDIDIEVNIKELTKKVCVDNAMLIFLDGRYNVKGNPNENFARELLELYTIGRGLDGYVPETDDDGDYYYYTEEDVQAAAKVLSGFVVDDSFLLNVDEGDGDPDTELPRGVLRGGGPLASSHDNTTKQFSVRFESQTISPDPDLLTSGQATLESSLDEISQLIDMIYNQDETPINICRRLYRFFVYHTISEELENDIIQEMADILVANNYKIHYVLEALFTSAHFYDGDSGYTDDNYGGIIKSPYDLTVGLHKHFNLSLPSYLTDYISFYDDYAGPILDEMASQGMDYYEPFEVAGYQAYHQFPIYNRNWITTGYLANRYDFVSSRIANNVNTNAGQIDVLNFVQNNIPTATARDAKALIISLAEYFLPMNEGLSYDEVDTAELTSSRLNYFLSAFLYAPQLDSDPEAVWTDNWDTNSDQEKMSNQLVNLINAMLQSPEYQLM